MFLQAVPGAGKLLLSGAKAVRRNDPCSSSHLNICFQFISLHENGQPGPDGRSDQAIAKLWLQHSLQFHCLSAQLRPLLGNRQYIRKFYAGK